eukprot:4433864-Amphidinium_carterae.1
MSCVMLHSPLRRQARVTRVEAMGANGGKDGELDEQGSSAFAKAATKRQSDHDRLDYNAMPKGSCSVALGMSTIGTGFNHQNKSHYSLFLAFKFGGNRCSTPD